MLGHSATDYGLGKLLALTARHRLHSDTDIAELAVPAGLPPEARLMAGAGLDGLAVGRGDRISCDGDAEPILQPVECDGGCAAPLGRAG